MEASTLPAPTTEKSDVFSISDQALSDRLQFIQEVIHFTARFCGVGSANLADVFRRLGLETGAASGYVVPGSLLLQQMAWGPQEDRRSQSNSSIDPKLLPLLRAFDLCASSSYGYRASYLTHYPQLE
jgi:hypothetical protein